MLQLNPDTLSSLNWQLKTKARSLGFGRRLYYLNEPGPYWLKTQLADSSSSVWQQVQQGFQHELEFYRAYQHAGLQCLLPAWIIQQPVKIAYDTFQQALILPDFPAYFDGTPETLSILEIQQYLLRVLEPLIELQELGYFHADLKREHFVHDQGRVYLIDFEQVHSLSESVIKEMNATPRYMAPELFHGKPKSLQSEVYALGIIFYEWLSGQRLQAASYEDWAYIHCQRFKLELPTGLKAFQKLLEGMLCRQQQNRLADFKVVKYCLMTEIE
ncbi:protein kinase [Acinetobacter bohemicus]|uniref:Protein kinase n=1 Tax=Acinetobacter lwoffii TaxID=28090 RepID=A0A9D2URF7_ACILW|nr:MULTISPECIES: protein kinase [Acinetobacter]MCO8042026.1 protein kinase [Acinetobacter sp. S4400-12]MCU7224120.1 protein kinase [Acinetobacter bohemicus]MDM1781724.1 protein kinase [Acinetobacter indicus]HJF27338.1 protein kinase [Acinetobacter lwoffii]